MFNWLKSPNCDGCGNPYPAHALIGIHNERYCSKCIQKVDKSLYWCDGCGEEYPAHHLEHDELYDGYFCRRCI